MVGLGKEFSSDPHPSAHWATALGIAAASVGFGGVTYDGVRRVQEVAAEAQLELHETIHTVGRILRVTLVILWVGACVVAILRFQGYRDIFVSFLRSGRNLEGNVDSRPRRLNLTATEARDVKSVLQRLRDWRPLALADELHGTAGQPPGLQHRSELQLRNRREAAGIRRDIRLEILPC